MPSSHYTFLKFQKEQEGTLPPTLAAAFLGVSGSRLSELARKGRLQFKTVAKARHYGVRSLREYKFARLAWNAHIRDAQNLREPIELP